MNLTIYKGIARRTRGLPLKSYRPEVRELVAEIEERGQHTQIDIDYNDDGELEVSGLSESTPAGLFLAFEGCEYPGLHVVECETVEEILEQLKKKIENNRRHHGWTWTLDRAQAEREAQQISDAMNWMGGCGWPTTITSLPNAESVCGCGYLKEFAGDETRNERSMS